MTSGAERVARQEAGASLAIDNLRAVVIVLVVAFHAVIAYLAFLPNQPYPFDQPPFAWRSFPIIDSQRWFGFDLFCAWLDVFLMSFFFLLSGLFVWPSLKRKGAGAFLTGRVLRLGLPFAVVVALLMPLALYPSYLQTASDPSPAAFWQHWLALSFWPCGPMWFLWLLLAGDAIAAGLYVIAARQIVVRLWALAQTRPARFLLGFAILAVIAYLPLALLFGSGSWVQLGPVSLQLSRPAHYALYFLAGVVLGAGGIEASLIAPNRPVTRHWARWLAVAAASFVLWIALTGVARIGLVPASLGWQALDDFSFSLACFTSCFFALTAAMRFGQVRSAAFASLTDNAYGIYLIHYLFVVWLQYALLRMGWPAVGKAAIVFAGAMALSWSLSAALRRIPACGAIVGMPRRRSGRTVAPVTVAPVTVAPVRVQSLTQARYSGPRLVAASGLPLGQKNTPGPIRMHGEAKHS